MLIQFNSVTNSILIKVIVHLQDKENPLQSWRSRLLLDTGIDPFRISQGKVTHLQFLHSHLDALRVKQKIASLA